MKIESRQLRYFIAVAEELNFHRAAARLNMTQPPLSMQIKALELQLGTKLLERTRHSVALTETGRVLLDRAQEALQRLDLAEEAVRSAGSGRAGLIRIGFVGSMPMLEVFSRLVCGFRDCHPLVRLELRHMSTAAQTAALAERELDVGFMRPAHPADPGPMLQVARSWTDRLMVFFPADSRLRRQVGAVDPAELADNDFVTVSSRGGCGIHTQSKQLCAGAGFVPRVTQEAHDLRTVLWLVAAGAGIALLPQCYKRAGIPNVRARAVVGPNRASQIVMTIRASERSPALSRFVDFAAAMPGQGTSAAPSPPR